MKLISKTVLATVALAAAILPQGEVISAENRTYTGGRFSLEISGVNAGFLKSFSGGGAKAEVAVVPNQGGGVEDKQVVNARYDDLRFQVGLDLEKPGATWIMDSINSKPGGKLEQDGAILMADRDLKAQRRVNFSDALITEVKFPALDAQAREPGYLSVTASPGLVELKLKGDGSLVAPSAGKPQKQWSSANFRLRLGGLPCERVLKIDSFKITRKLIEENLGEKREIHVTPGRIEYPNLNLTISAASLEPWVLWYQNFFVEGQSTDANELDGSIELLANDLRTVLATIDLKGVGMKAFNPFPSLVAGSEALSTFNVELYVEQMTLVINNH